MRHIGLYETHVRHTNRAPIAFTEVNTCSHITYLTYAAHTRARAHTQTDTDADTDTDTDTHNA